MTRRLQHIPVIQIFLGALIAAYMVVVKYTSLWHIRNRVHILPLIKAETGLIVLTWHSRFLMLNAAWRKGWQQPHVLISRSREGQIVAYASRFLGLMCIRGSGHTQKTKTNKGGTQAGRQILQAIANHGCIVITADGPRGPRQKLGASTLKLAQISGAPVIPCLFAVKRYIRFKSWDQFILPLPFNRGQVIWGNPVHLPSNLNERSLEQIRQTMELEMNDLLTKAEQTYRHDFTGAQD